MIDLTRRLLMIDLQDHTAWAFAREFLGNLFVAFGHILAVPLIVLVAFVPFIAGLYAFQIPLGTWQSIGVLFAEVLWISTLIVFSKTLEEFNWREHR